MSCNTIVGVVAALAIPLAYAQPASEYPTKAIRMIVPSAPGSGPDTMARAVGQQLSGMLGQPVVVENRGGAGGSIGGEAAAKAPADGYTLIMASAGSHAVNVGLYPRLAYEPIRDFAPISL